MCLLGAYVHQRLFTPQQVGFPYLRPIQKAIVAFSPAATSGGLKLFFGPDLDRRCTDRAERGCWELLESESLVQSVHFWIDQNKKEA